jgi:hypothetical protein
MYLLIPYIMVQYHYKWYQQIHIVPLKMVSTDTYCTIISAINRYILYHYKWYQQIHIVPLKMVSTDTYCTIMVQYVFVDTIYNGTICIC